MSAVFKRNVEDEGMEMPVREVVSRAMLCAMMDLTEDEPLHIFNSEGEEETCLLVLEAEYIPKKAGIYIIKLESEVQREQLIKELKNAPPLVLEAADYGDIFTLVWKFHQELIFPVNVIYNPCYEQDEKPTFEKEEPPPFAVLKHLEGKIEFEIAKGQVVVKEMICSVFDLDENSKYYILTPSEIVVKEFSEKNSTLDKNNFFAPDMPGDYILMSDAELAGVVGDDQPLEEKKAVLPEKKSPHDAENQKSFTDMMEILKELRFLNVVTNPWESDNFNLVMSRQNPRIRERKVEIQPYDLSDLQSFFLQGLVFQGDIDKCERAESLLKGCRAVQLHNINYKTFISHFNPMSIVAEMLKILKPKRAEIWLCRVQNSHNLPNVKKSFDDELTGKEWPFESVTEELKLVTATCSYLEEMQKNGFLSRVKVFEAIIVQENAASAVHQILLDFQLGRAGTGKLEMAQFVFPRCVRNILDGLYTSFENKMDGERRIRAGVPSRNGDGLAIVEIRSGMTYRVVTVAFTYDYLFQANRRRFFNKIEEYHWTVNPIFN